MDFTCTEKILTRNNDRGFEKSKEEILLDMQFRDEGNISFEKTSQEPLWDHLIQGLLKKF